ncbi:replication-associated protein [Avon-Heathcote Estuary associated circular virus 9]|uniref:Replication-associated protein n=1 Tax=Avon-Heathcote Estuary associated circular virus 9 TaxID=1618260 RepID=A0A0C5I2C5_9VIRU|nr:replication-associated protein [Avon-Heathcote Estuary associated circular virus 9]AJP36381.1 replication-associated protein [Avon-Heathcote Estuary associated circular virus 9]AJP36383.1 replication-associated protein [Avon-Heathcote Estuary associated circular virus 9]AJP36385.1 replication-associated protein [Avon-Heathcote Estuary associated circular virus 9]AJP36387.1 replication-associated protein [Avon-Heathcote Estuary associated circular virus 9]
MSDKHRSYSFTLNNYTDDEVFALTSMCEPINRGVKYLIFGKEIAPTTGTPHLQGCIIFTSPRSFKALKKVVPFNRANYKPTISEPGSARYCKKDGDVYEYGTPPKQGKRSDIENVRDILTSGGNIRDVVSTATSIQSVRMAEIHLKYFEKKRNWKPTVRWYYGATGTGKSKTAYEECDEHDPYVAMSTGKWFEGYDAHTHVIIDDMRKDFMKFHELLRMLDRYAFMVECKGGSRQFLATDIYITSCYAPDEMFESREDVNQLIRRLDEIRKFE